ncbi:hypothetical protein Dda_5620 [Drechslerella dactyloides]|uniref:Conidiation-specific protein 8 n=1 Tax=Drechslerella dactyloides TaxID=74499 RepID=A0AAD6NHQ2_DREDA|nr:hypothetical protein Dda_5620 [Drechslerella dactyloides]
MDQNQQKDTSATTGQQPRRSSFGPAFEGLQKRRSNSMSHAAKFDDQLPAAGFFGNAWRKFTTGRDHSSS